MALSFSVVNVLENLVYGKSNDGVRGPKYIDI